MIPRPRPPAKRRPDYHHHHAMSIFSTIWGRVRGMFCPKAIDAKPQRVHRIKIDGPAQCGKTTALLALYRVWHVAGMRPVIVMSTEERANHFARRYGIRPITPRSIWRYTGNQAFLFDDLEAFPPFVDGDPATACAAG